MVKIYALDTHTPTLRQVYGKQPPLWVSDKPVPRSSGNPGTALSLLNGQISIHRWFIIWIGLYISLFHWSAVHINRGIKICVCTDWRLHVLSDDFLYRFPLYALIDDFMNRLTILCTDWWFYVLIGDFMYWLTILYVSIDDFM